LQQVILLAVCIFAIAIYPRLLRIIDFTPTYLSAVSSGFLYK
jgi:hypothetical protein